MFTYILYQSENGVWYWALVEAGLGEQRTMTWSDKLYRTKEECEADIRRVKTSLAEAKTIQACSIILDDHTALRREESRVKLKLKLR